MYIDVLHPDCADYEVYCDGDLIDKCIAAMEPECDEEEGWAKYYDFDTAGQEEIFVVRYIYSKEIEIRRKHI
jgi:hypothetical protein